MSSPSQYYRLQALAQRGFYVPDVIPFEELEGNSLAAFRAKNSQTAATGPAGDKRNRYQGRRRSGHGRARTNMASFQEMNAPDPGRGDVRQEAQMDQMVRKGIY